MTADVLPALTASAHRVVHAAATASCACAEPGAVLADGSDATVVRHGAVVAKAHAPGSDVDGLAVRVAVAAHPALSGVLLAPLRPVTAALDGRQVTFWPYGTPVDPDVPGRVPWEAAGELLARLHRVDTAVLPVSLPLMRGPVKAALAVARLRAAGAHPGAGPVLRAWAALPAWARAEAPMPSVRSLCHGDLHLGQLVRGPWGAGAGVGSEAGAWRLIDVDDVGLGAPAWDLARPAASFACGVLEPGEWTRFLESYRRCGGPAVPAAGDPWPALDVPARALCVQIAALAIVKSVSRQRPLDDVQRAVIDTCGRMAGVAVAEPPLCDARAAPVPGRGDGGCAE